MKILTLHFKNINSLKGEWKIDFTDSPFSENSLFAITGPTGSGKTTLLDAICLALYHSTPRQGLVATNNELMTRGTGECFCEVEFEVKAIAYRARWYQHRSGKKTTGAFQSAKVELAEVLTGKILSNKIKTKLEKIEELTGLDFARFTKSMMLSQGQFAAFLNATENDRAELLEELTGSEIYGLISQKVFDNKKQLEHELEMLQAKQQGAQLLTIEEKTQYVELHSILKAKLSTLKNKQTITQDHKIWWDSYNKQQQKLESAKQASDEYLQAALSAKQDLQSLEASLPAQKIQPLFKQQFADTQKKTIETAQLDELKKSKQSINRIVDEKLHLKKLAEQNHKQSQQSKDNLDELLLKIDPLDIEIAQLIDQEKRLSIETSETKDQLTRQLSSNKQEQQAHIKSQEEASLIATYLIENESVQQLANQLPLWQSQFELLARNQSSLIELEKKRPEIKQSISTITKLLASEKKNLELQLIQKEKNTENITIIKDNQKTLLKNTNINTLKETLEQLISSALPRESLLHLHTQNNKQRLLQQKASQQVKVIETDLIQYKLIQKNSLKSLLEQKESVEELEYTNNLEIHIAGLDAERNLLKAGEPCTLCGSLTHPNIEKYKRLDQSKTENKLSKSRQLLEKEQANLNDTNNRLATNEIQLSHQHSIIEAAKSEQLNIKQQWKKLNACSSSHLKIDALAEIEQFLSDQDTHIKSLKTNLLEIETSKSALHLAENENQKVDLNIERHKAEITLLNSKMESEENEENKLQAHIETQLKDIKVQEHKIKDDLACFNLTFPDSNNVKKWVEGLQIKTNFYKEQQNKQIVLSKSSATLSEKIKSGTAKLLVIEKVQEKQSQTLSTTVENLTKGKETRHELFTNKVARDERLKSSEHIANCLDSVTQASNLFEKKSRTLNAIEGQIIEKSQHVEQLGLTEMNSQKDWYLAFNKSPFSTQIDFQKALLNEQEFTRISTIKDLLSTQKTKTETIEAIAQQAILDLTKTEQQKLNLTKPLDIVREELTQLNTLIEENNNESGSIAEKIKADELTRSNLTSLIKEIDGLTMSLEDLRYLDSLIGSAKGDKFRKFAQGLTLEYLVALANKQLARLDGRYLLQRNPNEDLSLQILDSWQADEVRNTQTLSGGESFLVSLALALGLSDLVSHKTSIDSLFLDEGFGTLDSQTLDIALNALDGLNASGKMIGVISHVEAMKERIPTQIKVTKISGMGISKLESQFSVNTNS